MVEQSPDAPEHPKPQFRRQRWLSLDGEWRFRYDDDATYRRADEVTDWPLRIRVPFAPESQLSGIGDTGFHRTCWYERDFAAPELQGGRLLLHFGAVDYSARVWINDTFVGEHIGGHTPFTFDITALLRTSGQQKLSVRVDDDPGDLAKPRGKQDWQLEPHSIWYPRTTGIWQSVWVEPVPDYYLSRIRWTPHLERWEIGFEAFLGGSISSGTVIRLRLSACGQTLTEDVYGVIEGEVHRRIALSDPGVDDFRNELLWSPERPTLIGAEVELWFEGRLIDRIESYTALRSVAVQHGDFMLNGRPYYLRLVLDQGYWPESLMTPPSTAAVRRDIELTKAMGFNGVRKHQKIEDPRYLHMADKMGLLVWEEMPSAYRFTHEAVGRIVHEWTEAIERDFNHPCIAVWVSFNESWGVPDLAEKAAHRHCVQALYHLTKTLDPTRPVVGNDGWESTATDIIGIHDYDNHPTRLSARYGPARSPAEVLSRRTPAGRMLTVEGYAPTNQPIMLTEFGGIAYVERTGATANAWGYGVSDSLTEFHGRFSELLAAVHELELFRGFCYTQLTDTFQEANGLLYADRRPKLPIGSVAEATTGNHSDRAEVTIGSPREGGLTP